MSCKSSFCDFQIMSNELTINTGHGNKGWTQLSNDAILKKVTKCKIALLFVILHYNVETQNKKVTTIIKKHIFPVQYINYY